MEYHHLTLLQREKLYAQKQAGKTQREIAQALGVSQSTISRELPRNRAGPQLGYLPDRADAKADKRRRDAKKLLPFWYEYESLLEYVHKNLTSIQHWSPEQISGRIKDDHPDNPKMRVSHESIYQYIWNDKRNEGELHTNLRNRGKHNHKRGKKDARGTIPNRKDISTRPVEVETKKIAGHYESDLIIGLLTSREALLTIVGRTNKRLFGGKVRRTAEAVAERTIEIFIDVPPALRKTMTHDNGKEISAHEKITVTIGMEVYCARPYHSWERGLNEFTNRFVRQYFPKGTDFDTVSEEDVQEVYEAINNRPRKILQYRTPNEVFAEELRLCTSD